MSESPLEDLSDRTKRAGVAVLSDRAKLVAVVVVLLALLYGVLVLRNAAAFLSLVLSAAFLWLVYRFVVAHERIAAAQERRVRAVEAAGDAADRRSDAPGESTLDDSGTDADPDHESGSGGR